MRSNARCYVNRLTYVHDRHIFNEKVNTLINPKSFYEYAARKKEVLEVEHANRKERITQALAGYEKIKNQNALLQELYKRNMFFDAEEWEALDKEGKMPKKLYRITGKDQVLTTSTEYNEAVDLIKTYSENVNEIPLQYNTDLDQYDTTSRDRLPGDNRTYEQIAEQYGFDPKARKTTLSLREVLQAVMNSDFATEEEIALARRLFQIAKPEETVTFSKELAGPGVYTPKEQTVIDARYSSSEYAENAQSYPIEVSILREEVNRRIYDLLRNDKMFQDNIRTQLQNAYAYYANNITFYPERPLGLRSMEDFLKEALTSQTFREFLHEVAAPQEGTSGWGQFVNSIITTLQSDVGEFSNTALNAVIASVTSKIDSTYTKAQDQASGVVRTEEEAPVRELSVEQLEAQYPDLLDRLIEIYKDYNQIFIEVDE